MKKCVFCEKEFDELSCEHIIPNVLCGHLKSKDLLCVNCNNTLGNTVDKLLNGKFDMIINIFGLARENGITPPAAAKLMSGRPCSILHGGHPVGNDVQIDMSTDPENHISLHITAPENKIKLLNMEISKFVAQNKDAFMRHGVDYKNAIPNIIKGVSEKITKDEVQYRRTHEPIRFQIALGGSDLYRPILKMLYLFLLHHRRDVKINRRELVNKIESGKNICNMFFYCFDPQNLFLYKHVGLYHSIGIKSFREDRKLLGFIDLFGMAPYICILDDNYDGEDVLLAYGYDLLRSKEEMPEVNFPPKAFNIKDKYDFKATTRERLAHFREKCNYLLQLFEFYSIPERIIQDLLVAVNYDPSVSQFFSDLKPKLQQCIVSAIDNFFPQKERGCAFLHECILRGMLSAFQEKPN